MTASDELEEFIKLENFASELPVEDWLLEEGKEYERNRLLRQFE